MTNAIETSGLVKTFGETRALDHVDLSIRGGSVYGVLGPNGAGKTTLIRVLTTLLKPTSGRASVLGHDVVRDAAIVRQKVSLTGQYASVDEDLTGHENLVLVSRLLGLSWSDAGKRATELLAAFGLSEAARKQVRTFSGGMRRRIDIAASLVTRPEILFLDEPTSGLDPRSRNQVWDLVRQIAADGTTVLLTTQYLEEADRLAERLAVVDHGRIIAEGTSRDLKASIGTTALHFQLEKQDQLAQAQALVSRLAGGALPSPDAMAFSLKVSDVSKAAEILSELSRAKIEVSDFSLGAPSLDDVFFALTGRPTAEKNGEKAEEKLVSVDAITTQEQPLVMHARRKPVSALSAVGTLAWRAMLKIKHVPFQLFDVTVTPIMFTLLFTYIFGGALGGTPEAYIQFLLPGILVQTIVFITVYTGVGLNTDIQKGLYDRFRSLPIWQPAPVLGALAGDLFRYSVASLLIVVIGVILGFRPEGGAIGVLLAFALVLVFCFAVSWIWIIFAMKVTNPESVMTMSFVFLMPLTFASNIFVGIETMPPWLQAIVRHNPVTHLTNASRGLMHGTDVTGEVVWVLVASAAIVAVAAPVALRMYHQER